jgi:hypothetical protein
MVECTPGLIEICFLAGRSQCPVQYTSLLALDRPTKLGLQVFPVMLPLHKPAQQAAVICSKDPALPQDLEF